MVTLIDPGQGLWPLIWANVPYGRPAGAGVLPWMRPTRTSERGGERYPEGAHPAEAFFGMPRRLRLVAEGGRVTGVIQRPSGTNYAGWIQPLSPYYRLKQGAEWLPKHPRPGLFGYRNWLGVLAAMPDEDVSLQRRAQMVRSWHERRRDLPGLADRDVRAQGAIVEAHRRLRANLAGQGAYGRKAFEALELPTPRRKEDAA